MWRIAAATFARQQDMIARMENSRYRNLKLLWWLRTIAIGGQAAAILVATMGMGLALNTQPLWEILAGMVLVNGFTAWRIRRVNDISDCEFFAQLCLDMLALFGLLYFTGGATNSFTSLFILQVVIAAIALPAIYSWLAAAITIALYTILMFHYVEVPHLSHHGGGGDFFSLHVQGMWISFMLLAGIIAWFIARMNRIIRRQDALLADAERMAALGTLATGAAHELGTPLAIMAVLAEDCETTTATRLSDQIARCKAILARITAAGGVARAEGGAPMTLQDFLTTLLAQWQKEHPGTQVRQTFAGMGNPSIVAEASLEQALINLLNNAADASPHTVSIEANWTAQTLTIQIHDEGTGVDPSIRAELGKPGISTKTHGLGLGVFLAKNVIQRLEGALHIRPSTSGTGTTAHITLPLRKLAL